ncbi:hypothetical protein HK099_001283 [Clydaea vesicula]|uniref:Large ribosomal subunit protein uL24 C-terminal domain-containing protein n=1 Tax=Clydaea vesicula TaxID=447962 RepID=A0AAD5TVS5_9FUNG|nr:hypothetical protein HK099_001283 [Clydaea vesicula]
MKLKVKHANLVFRKVNKDLRKSQIIPEKDWTIFVGDNVEVVAGNIDYGKRGTVLQLHKKTNKVTVDGINQLTKHIKPNSEVPDGARYKTYAPIEYHCLNVVDNTVDQPTETSMYTFKDSISGKYKTTRISSVTGNFLPIPKQKGKFKGLKVGTLDTSEKLIRKVTYTQK